MAGKSGKRGRRVLPLLVLLTLGAAGAADSQEKVTIGLVEDVILMPWRIKLPARVDTGAAVSSLDARDLKVIGREVEFALPSRYGGKKFRLPVAGWQTVRSAEAKERRPFLDLEVCLGSKLIRARVNLNDRSQMKYPFLIGRNLLTDNFVVDCDRTHCAPPQCPEVEERSK